MATTQRKLKQLETNLDESIGIRRQELTANLSPIASAKDIGRRPLRNVGRIEIKQVIPDPDQPRTEFSEESIQRLGQSIREKGQLAPIRVRWSEAQRKWIIVCGERRWRAVTAAGLPTIDCYFDDGMNASESEILEQQMVENLLRDNLSPLDLARGFSALIKLNNWTRKQVAASLHIPASTVSRALALLDLPSDVQEQVEKGAVAARSAYEISKLDDATEQRRLAEKAANGMTLKQTQAAIQERSKKPKINRRNSDYKPQRLKFVAENGWSISATPPKSGRRNYHDVLQAMEDAIEDVKSRINANIRID